MKPAQETITREQRHWYHRGCRNKTYGATDRGEDQLLEKASNLGMAGLTQGDSIGPFDIVRHQRLPVHTIEPRLLDLGLEPPVRPIHVPKRKKSPTWFLVWDLAGVV